MGTFLLDRGDTVLAICSYLETNISDLNLVKPYEGELDRYRKLTQLKQEIFPAEVNLLTPFALVISKERHNMKQGGGRTLRLKHDISIYIGVAKSYDFASTAAPTALALLNTVAEALHGRRIIANAEPLVMLSDGEYLVSTDLFTVYDQKYYQLEIGY